MAGFEYRQAIEIRDAFANRGVNYLFIGAVFRKDPIEHERMHVLFDSGPRGPIRAGSARRALRRSGPDGDRA